MKPRTTMILGLAAAATYPALGILVPVGLLLALFYGRPVDAQAGVSCGAVYVLLMAYIVLLVKGKKKVLPVVVGVWLAIWLILLGRSSPETAYWRPASAMVRPLTLWYMVLADRSPSVSASLPRLSGPSLFFLDIVWGLVTMALLWLGVKGCEPQAGGRIFALLRAKSPARRSELDLGAWLPAEAPGHSEVQNPVGALLHDDVEGPPGIPMDYALDSTASALEHDDKEITPDVLTHDDVESAADATTHDDVEDEEESQTQPEATMRRCTRCNELKDEGEFRRQDSLTDGLRCWCIECEREHDRQSQRPAEQAKTPRRKNLRSQDRHRVVKGLRKKRCRICKRWKPEDRFSPDRRNGDGLDGRCKQCKAQAERQCRKRRLVEADYLARKALIAPATPL